MKTNKFNLVKWIVFCSVVQNVHSNECNRKIPRRKKQIFVVFVFNRREISVRFEREIIMKQYKVEMRKFSIALNEWKNQIEHLFALQGGKRGWKRIFELYERNKIKFERRRNNFLAVYSFKLQLRDDDDGEKGKKE